MHGQRTLCGRSAKIWGKLTFANPDIRILEAPLLGTGAGRLDTLVAGEALYRGFRETSVADSRLYIFVFDAERITALERIVSEIQSSSGHEESVASPRIFISHSSVDVETARILVDLLEKSLHLNDSDIRCTSLPGYGLPAGATASMHLREEIQNAELVLGIIDSGQCSVGVRAL